MFTPAREPKIHFPPLPCRPWQLDVALHEFPSNTALAAQPARTTIESRTSCALSWSSQLLKRAVYDPYALSSRFSRTQVRPT
jgi:hypothetical protein